MKTDTDNYTVPAGADIGHVHLNVSDVNRSLAFYHGVLGFAIVTRMSDRAAFVSAGGYHHHIGLNSWQSAGGKPPPRGSTGLFHLAVRYPTPQDLGVAVQRVLAAGIALSGATDHGVSRSVYLADPDGNGVELYHDQPEALWPRNERGEPEMFDGKALDLANLLKDQPTA